MRHVPPLDDIIERIDGKIRVRLTTIASIAERIGDENHPLQRMVKSACRQVCHIAEVARHRTHGHANGNGSLTQSVNHSLTVALEALRAVDRSVYGRRMPFHRFERSECEEIYAAVVAVSSIIEEAIPVALEHDASAWDTFFTAESSKAPEVVVV